jgi:drug/metabolite transporter (DMT)-like permease
LNRRSSELSIFGALVCAQTFLGAFPVAAKVALESIPPLPFALFRVAGASVVLWAIRPILPRDKIDREDLPRLALLAFLGVAFNQILYIEGLSLSTAINASVLMTTIPVLTLGIAIIAGREGASTRKLLGCVLGLAGALTILDVTRFDLRSRLFLGDAMLLTNATAYSTYLVLSRDLLRKYSAPTFIRITFSMGAIPILAFAAAPLAKMSFARVTPTAWACMAAVILFPSVIGYVLNAWALARTHASRVALFVTLQPFVATTLAVFWLSEEPSARAATAAALIFAGLLVSRPPLPRRSP